MQIIKVSLDKPLEPGAPMKMRVDYRDNRGRFLNRVVHLNGIKPSEALRTLATELDAEVTGE